MPGESTTFLVNTQKTLIVLARLCVVLTQGSFTVNTSYLKLPVWPWSDLLSCGVALTHGTLVLHGTHPSFLPSLMGEVDVAGQWFSALPCVSNTWRTYQCCRPGDHIEDYGGQELDKSTFCHSSSECLSIYVFCSIFWLLFSAFQSLGKAVTYSILLFFSKSL